MAPVVCAREHGPDHRGGARSRRKEAKRENLSHYATLKCCVTDVAMSGDAIMDEDNTVARWTVIMFSFFTQRRRRCISPRLAAAPVLAHATTRDSPATRRQ